MRLQVNKKLLKYFEEFSEYLDDWDNKRSYYINELLPNLKDGYSFSELKSKRARELYNDIWKYSSSEEWLNFVNIIVKIKEGYAADLFTQLKEKYNFEGFIHTACFENFINIMQEKYLYCRNLKKMHIDTADNDVISNTPDFIKNYVRFYWRPKTPTNYRNEGIKPKKILNIKEWEAHSPVPVIMIFNSCIAQKEGVNFSDGNCASKERNIIKNIKDTSCFNWDYVFWDGVIPNYENIHKITYTKQAELLYPQKISTSYINKIVFRSVCDKERAEMILGRDPRYCVDSTYFENSFLYVKEYNFNTKTNTITITYNKGECMYKYNVSISDYTHSFVVISKNNKKQKVNISKSSINEDEGAVQFKVPIDKESEYICYNIDDIECIRIKVND